MSLLSDQNTISNTQDKYDRDEIYYVYMLLDPRKEPSNLLCVLGQKVQHEVFYVGKGMGNRFRAHFKSNTNKIQNSHKRNTIRAIRADGMEPILFLVKTNIDEYRALSLESSLIMQVGRRNFHNGPLTNRTDGMDGCRNTMATKETRMKMSESALNRGPVSEETRLRMRESQGKRPQPSEETKRKCSTSLSEMLTIIVSPEGIVELTNNLQQFCESHGFTKRTFVRHNRTQGSYLGWKFINMKVHHRKEKMHENWFELGKKLFENGIDLKEYGHHRIQLPPKEVPDLCQTDRCG